MRVIVVCCFCYLDELPWKLLVFPVLLFYLSLVNGKELGKIPSKLLCKSMIDAYFGPDAFDKEARQEFKSRLISMLHEKSSC